MKEAYCKVIDILVAGKINSEAMVLALAKANPKAFLLLHAAAHGSRVTAGSYGSTSDGTMSEMDAEILRLWGAQGKVAAIKYCRTVTGWGLKEAKDHCEKVAGDALVKPMSPPPAPGVGASTADLDELSRELAQLLDASDDRVEYPDGGSF